MLASQASEAGWNSAQVNAGGQAPNRLSYGWSARFDTETCNFRRWKLLERSVVFWQHTSVVRMKIGFNSRTDLLKNINGLFVQWEDAWFATRKSGFESPTVHSATRAHGPTGRRRHGMAKIWVRFPVSPLIRKVAGYGWPGRTANAVLPHRRSGFESLPFRLCLDGETEIIPRF